ncbi:FAD/NAD(P)-binding oxidoreductase, partial [Mucilaginibacter sp. 5B2]|nr:FAD/NAD(P)-binding oxidoreductase [Mucilaginibacter sp. 5B2]
ATPPQSAPDFIKKSPLAVKDDPLGWVDLHKDTMQHNQFKNIFGCGDASSTPNSKTGAAIREQAPVLVKNLLSLMDGKQLAEKYNGYSSCPLVTGYGKLILAEFDYNNEPLETFPFDQGKERYSIWLLKTKVLPWLYWDKILKGTA